MKTRLNIQLLTAAILSLGGLALLFCGVCIDPQGEIHESLLIGFGEVATFAGALFGIDYTYKQKYNPLRDDEISQSRDDAKKSSSIPSGFDPDKKDSSLILPDNIRRPND